MIGFDFPIRPEWVHDVHLLCEPEMLVDELVSRVLAATMQELGGRKTRKNTLGNIIRYLVRTEGHPSTRSRRLATCDALTIASKSYPVEIVKPAYLFRLLLFNDVARSATAFLAKRHEIGDTVSRGNIRHHIVNQFGERKVVLNAVSSYVRTLEAFGIFTAAELQGTYNFASRLPVGAEVFPLLVMSWTEWHSSPQIELDAFQHHTIFHCFNTDNFALLWQKYARHLWSLETRLGTERATLKYPETAAFERVLVTSLSLT